MRRTALLALLPLVVAFAPAPASTDSSLLVQNGPGVGGFMSDNVTYVGTIPLDSPGVGGRMVKVGNQMRFYVTGVKGLTIYDVTDPSLPKPLGFFPYYHAQNEDVDVSDDGKRVVIGADGALLVGLPGAKVGIHIIDTTDPANPVLLGSIADSNHTATCADPKCEWIYGSNGVIYDARNPASIQRLARWKPTTGSAHALNRDESGLMVSDSNPRYVLDPRVDPANPIVLTEGSRKSSKDDSLQHNNVRPNALDWVPRDPEDPNFGDPNLRPGELLIGNSESNLNSNCGSLPGGLSTWSMTNFDKGQPMQQLHSFLPKVGDYSDGSPPGNALGCSGHWFTYRNGIVAAAWYEHGLRFFKINEQTGAISQVGFFNPVATEAGAAHWVADAAGNEYVYTVDYARGIDIVKFCRTCPVPTAAESKASWAISAGRVGALSGLERFACQLAVRGYKVG
jgi:hypothetical protein